jgi:hypothetical protein
MATDTTASARRAQIEALRRLGPEGRLALAVRMSDDARTLAIEGAMRRDPRASREEAERQVFTRLWGRELYEKVQAYLAAAR